MTKQEMIKKLQKEEAKAHDLMVCSTLESNESYYTNFTIWTVISNLLDKLEIPVDKSLRNFE